MELFAHHTPEHTLDSTVIFGALLVIGIFAIGIYFIAKQKEPKE